jgi:hypothetical protein
MEQLLFQLPTPDGTGVILIGGIFTDRDLRELKCTSTSCNWRLMEKQLSVQRYLPVASSYAVCEHYKS